MIPANDSSLNLCLIHDSPTILKRWKSTFEMNDSINNIQLVATENLAAPDPFTFSKQSSNAIIIFPYLKDNGICFDWDAIDKVFNKIDFSNISKLIVLSSAAIYGSTNKHRGYIVEQRYKQIMSHQPYASQWLKWENIFLEIKEKFSQIKITILRPSFMLIKDSNDWFINMLNKKSVSFPFGFNSVLQILSEHDLLSALTIVIKSNKEGIYNLAPEKVISWNILFKQFKIKKRFSFGILEHLSDKPFNLIKPFLRYSWTVNSSNFKKNFNYETKYSSYQTVAKFLSIKSNDEIQMDPFGLDVNFIKNRIWIKLALSMYWRAEIKGLENLPSEGSGILAGPHRGFMPYDAAVLVYILTNQLSKPPRFLVHHALLKFPIMTEFFKRMGSVPACRENAETVLENNELLGLFPEGINGTFCYYRDSKKIGSLGRPNFIKWSLKYKVPIYPFLIVGSAETYPIFFKINWKWLDKIIEWPAYPITATFPFIPIPLPTKWHIEFLPPIHFYKEYSADMAEDINILNMLSNEFKERLQKSWDELHAKRKNIFWGKIWD